MAYIIQCDRCQVLGGKGESSHIEGGWKQLRLQVGDSGYTAWKAHQFCPECVEYLGIKADIVEETSAEKLVAILESMVEEAVSERDG